MRASYCKRELGVSSTDDIRTYRKLYYKYVESKRDRKYYDKVVCECGQTIANYSLEKHYVRNKHHIFFMQNKHNPTFVEEYFKIVNNTEMASNLKAYYFRKLKKKYNYDDNDSSSSRSNSDTSSEDDSN